MKSQSSSSIVPSFAEAAPQIPALFSNAHRAETVRQLQQAGYSVDPQKLPRLQVENLGFDPEEEEGAMPWVAERGRVVHQAYGEFLQTSYRFMLVNVTLNTVADQARARGYSVTGSPGSDRPDGVAVEPKGTSPTPLTNLVELKPKGTALTGPGPAQVTGYQKALERCGLETRFMPQNSPLANVILPVVGYGDVEFTGMQDGIVGYTQLRRQPAAPVLAPQQAPEQAEQPSFSALYQYLKQLAEAVEVSLEVALGLVLLLVAIVVMGLLLHLPPPVPV